jgi:hypothetical protein
MSPAAEPIPPINGPNSIEANACGTKPKLILIISILITGIK